jgi:hypothetical protein
LLKAKKGGDKKKTKEGDAAAAAAPAGFELLAKFHGAELVSRQIVTLSTCIFFCVMYGG